MAASIVETYVVRVLRADDGDDHEVHGVVRRVVDGTDHRFASADELVDVLRLGDQAEPQRPTREDDT